MPILESWELNQANSITFVMVDAMNAEVSGLGNTFTVEISKNGGPFIASAGVKSEIGSGWYHYVSTAGEANTVGTVSIKVTGAGCIQQNLEYVVFQRNAGCIEFTYTVTSSITGLPLSGVEVWVSTDLASPPADIVWYGYTDGFGVARDDHGHLPCLDIGTYYFWKHHVGFIDDDNPDTEVVS